MLTDNPSAPLILVVEDDDIHADLMRLSLQDAPVQYRLEIVGTLHDARMAISRQVPDIVLTDYRLPDGDGSELVPTVNGLSPVVLLTSQGNEQVAVEAMKAGAQDYVVKSAESFTAISRIAQRCMREWGLIRDQRRAEADLRTNEAKQRAMVANISDVITIVDKHGINRYKSPNIEKWFGWSPEEVVDSSIWDYLHPGDLSRMQLFIAALLQVPHADGTEECRFRCKDGSYKYVEFTAVNLLLDPDIQGVLLNYRDISERKLAERELRSYASRLIELEESLRKKLASELHDEIGRDLTAIGMNLSIIGTSLKAEAPPKILEMLHDSAKLVEGISRTVRGLMSYLRPPVLDDFGLLSAIRWHTDLYTKRNNIAVHIQADEFFPRLPPTIETSLFRISQEALLNVAKYARPTLVTITLQVVDSTLLFAVADDGTGFDADAPVNHQHDSGWGMKIMRDRVDLIGGSFRVESMPGKGSVVSVSVPLKDV